MPRLREHGRRRIHPHQPPPRKARPQRPDGRPVAAAQIDHIARRQVAHLRQQVQRRTQPQAAKGGIGGRIPVAYSHFFHRKISQGTTADTTIATSAAG